MSGKKPIMADCAGAEITRGCTVRQVSPAGQPWYAPDMGALICNAGETGTVVGMGLTRVRVDFGRTKRALFGRQVTDEPAIDAVAPGMLRVVVAGEGKR